MFNKFKRLFEFQIGTKFYLESEDCLGFGVSRLGFRVWGLAFGVWRLVFGVWCLALNFRLDSKSIK
jgi:hypothetical protein